MKYSSDERKFNGFIVCFTPLSSFQIEILGTNQYYQLLVEYSICKRYITKRLMTV